MRWIFLQYVPAVAYTLAGVVLCIWTFHSLNIILSSSRHSEAKTVKMVAKVQRELALVAPFILLNELRAPGRWELPAVDAELVVYAKPPIGDGDQIAIGAEEITTDFACLATSREWAQIFKVVSALSISTESVEQDLTREEFDLSAISQGLKVSLLHRKKDKKEKLVAIYGQWLSENESLYFRIQDRPAKSATNTTSASSSLMNDILLNRIADAKYLKIQFGKSSHSFSDVSNWLSEQFWDLHASDGNTIAATKNREILYAFPCSDGGSWLVWIEST